VISFKKNVVDNFKDFQVSSFRPVLGGFVVSVLWMMRPKSLLLAGLSLSFLLNLQAQTTGISGKYEGTADLQGAGTLKISAEISEIGNKITGVIHTPLGDAEIIEGSYSASILALTVDAGGDDLLLNGNVSADRKISGQVSGEIAKGTFELKRVGDIPPESETKAVTHQSKDKWHEDLRFLAAELPKKHKNAFNLISKEQFDSMVADLDSKIPSLSDEQIILGMGRIVSRIGDGHTGLGWAWLFPRVPIRMFWFGKELRVVQAGKAFPRLSGARITRIDGRKVEELYERSREYIAPNESEQYVLNADPYLLTYPVFLKVLGAGNSDYGIKFDFTDLRGHKGSIELKAAAPGEKIDWIEAYKTAPLYLQHPDEPFFYEYLKDAKTVYVNFKWYPRRPQFKKFSNELFNFIDKNDVRKLVFDLRLNGGGDFTRGRDYFIKPLKERKKFLERGRLFTIIGRQTFSAGMANSADFRNDLKAILVGEPTGARPNGYQENRSFSLPNSHLPVSYSTELYKFSETDTPGIIPDKLIAPAWKSYLAGRDPVMEWILSYPSMK